MYDCYCFFCVSLTADGSQRAIIGDHFAILPACGHFGIFPSISPRFSPTTFYRYRCKFSTLTPRQPMVEFYLLTFSRFQLRETYMHTVTLSSCLTRVVTKDLPISPRFSLTTFYRCRCKFITPRQPIIMIETYLLMFSPFQLQKPEI